MCVVPCRIVNAIVLFPRYMLGRGVKRKRSDYEEAMGAMVSGAPGAMVSEAPGAMVSGAPGPLLDLPYMQQRQQVLNMCLSKLQSCHMRPEPSLHRSVLLANTLRQIQDEMRREGWEPPAAPPPAPSRRHAAAHPQPAARALGLPAAGGSAAHSDPALPSPPAPPSEEGRSRGERGAPACPGCAESEGQGVSSSSSPALSSSSSSSSSPPALSSTSEDSRSPDLLFGSFEITNSTSYLTDLAFDDIFEDIDTSMYDSSDFSVLAFPRPRGPAVPRDRRRPQVITELHHSQRPAAVSHRPQRPGSHHGDPGGVLSHLDHIVWGSACGSE
ncbi:hypothetical protein AAFF_G00415810 [Aldrovandia affinis]|uniref:SERTA domain-containing protein n=1 Tax=Aldrovandia affinis TaxID=143900 RepID=A0AAD7SBD0_9TELE|nr:hypothetical protein AAFF_G00415810 [Aldrovandia affinis]